MVTAHNLTEMKKALGMLQFMAQNIMVGTVDGDIYYVRNGRVPVRPKGCDISKPCRGPAAIANGRGFIRLKTWCRLRIRRGVTCRIAMPRRLP